MKHGLINFFSILFLTVFIVAEQSEAAFNLPKALSVSEQKEMFEVLGFGAAYKHVANTYPLGGYSGIEVGVSLEVISADGLKNLGSGTTGGGDSINLFTLSVAKGLYHNVDVGFTFSPFFQSEGVRSYNGYLRWGFYEFENFPMILSATLYGGGANYQNLLSATTVGGDLMATVTMDDISIYTGFGRLRSNGTFIGGPDGITADGNASSQDMYASHVLFGVSVGFDSLFIALQADRYNESVYSGKLGFRF